MPGRWRARIPLWALLTLSLYAVPVHFYAEVHTANEAIRFYFTQALVDHHEASLDRVMARYRVRNVDVAHRDGKSYLDKAPGVSLLSVPPYFVLTRLGMSTKMSSLPQLRYLLLLLVIAIPAALGALFTYRTACDLGGEPAGARRAAILLALCSPYALYATLFFGHTLAAALLAGAFHYAQRVRRQVLDVRFALLAGALAGVMFLVETTTALLAAGIGLYLLSGPRRFRVCLAFGAGAAPFVLAQLVYNLLLFGGPLVFGYAHKPAAGYGSLQAAGLFGIRTPALWSFARLLFGSHRGLFFGWPALALAIPGFWMLWRRRTERAEWWTISLLCVGYALAISSMPDWNAGAVYGPRHFVGMLPLLVLPVAHLRGTLVRTLAPGLLVASFLATWAIALTFPYAMDGFANPIFEEAGLLLAEGLFGPSLATLLGGPAFLAPLLVIGLALALVWVLWREERIAPPRWAALATVVLPVLWLLGGAAATPAQTPENQIDRADIMSMLGPRGVEKARAICDELKQCPRRLLSVLGR